MNETRISASWEEISGQPAAAARLKRMLETDRVPHALLFAGPPRTGKTRLAEFFAAQILRTDSSGLEGHPDYFNIGPDGAQIRIGQIRELQRLAGLAPMQGRCRVCLLAPADCMEAPAANSLLKILEEPPEGMVFILITAQPHSLLPTLRSRTAMIRCLPEAGPLSDEEREQEAGDRNRAMELLRNIGRPDLEWIWPVVSEIEGLENIRILDIIKQWIRLLRDVGVVLAGSQGVLAFNEDRRAEIVSMTGRWDFPRILSAIGVAEETGKHLQRNANSRLMLESLLIRTADLYWGGNVYADHSGGSV